MDDQDTGNSDGADAVARGQTRTAVQRERSAWSPVNGHVDQSTAERKVRQSVEKDNDTMLDALEPEQFSFARHKPLPRRTLRAWELVTLWVLRVYVVIVLILAVVQFIRTLP